LFRLRAEFSISFKSVIIGNGLINMNVIINHENRKKLDFWIEGITVWPLYSRANNIKVGQGTPTGMHETLVNWPILIMYLNFLFVDLNHRMLFEQ